MSQHAFAAALLDPDLPVPTGLTAWNGSDPAQRFRVYRNNVIVSLIDALADTFEVTQQLVGEDFFRAMARLYVYGHPPQSPLMAFYGASLPDFIETFPPAAGLPYLADVARLEYLRVVAYHAADVPGVGDEALAAALADQAALPTLGATLQPSLAVLVSASAVVSLWAAHQDVLDLSAVAPETPETALILRPGLDVEVIRIPPAAGTFITALGAGSAL
ncbi:MAG TPA: DNA-binding domain-containing protein, partial [Azonexus sp.]|nr:DNA-binding domain-containing protein [Azonexus sp.]